MCLFITASYPQKTPPMNLATQRFRTPATFLSSIIAITTWLTFAPGVSAGPFDAWSNSMKVTFNYQEYEPLNNFPVLVILKPSLPGFSYSQFASANGSDLRFADENGNEIPYEIEKWNPSGESLIWVQVPKLIGNRSGSNYVDGQWIGRWGWNGQDGFARRHTNNQLYAEKVVGGDSPTTRQFCGGGEPITVFGVKPYVGKYFAIGDPRTGWTPPGPYGTYTDGQFLGTVTDPYWPNRLGVNGNVYVKYDAALDCYYTVIGSTAPNAVFWGAGVSGGVMGTGAQFEQEAQHFVGFDPRSPNAPIGRDNTDPWYYDWSPNNYVQYINWAGLNKRTTLTSITAYWGNASATVAPAYTTSGIVWTAADFVGVWHMNQTAAQDATKRIANGTPTSVALTSSGRIGDAVDFNTPGSSKIDFGTIALGFSGNRGYTIEGWVKRNTDGAGPAVSYGGTSTGGSMSLGMDGSGNFKTVRHVNTDRTYPQQARQGQWDYVSFVAFLHNNETTQSGFVDHLFVNGDWAFLKDAGDSTNKINLPASGPLIFGKESWGNNTSGSLVLDEVRISKRSRTYNWQRCTYLTIASNSSFTTYGAVSNGQPPPSLWTAYNDLAWESGQLETKITQYGMVPGQSSSGNLIDFTSGSPLGATLSFSSTGTTPALAGVVSSALPGAGSDADTAFTNKVDLQSRAFWSGGSVTMTLSGLNPASRYSVVLYGARGVASYTTRWTDVKISDNSGFINSSSSGSTILTSSVANDTTRIVTGDNAIGRVFRFDDINPGSDGDVVFTLTGNGSEAAYINAVRVATYPIGVATPADSDGDGMSDAAEALFGTNPSSANSRVIVTAGLNGSNQRVVGWPTVNGRQYRVEYCDALGSPWQTLTTITATGATWSYTDTTTPIPAKRFYRIVAL